MREHIRHKSPTPLEQPRELVIACLPLRSGVNLSRIARAAGCCGVTRIVAAGRAKLDPQVARDAVETITLDNPRTLGPALERLRGEDYQIVGLEQTSDSVSLHEFSFLRRTALVIGNERAGISDELLPLLDVAVEIPVWGLPHSYNVATATGMAMYEYCRQFPRG